MDFIFFCYEFREKQFKLALNFPSQNIAAVGTMLGKFTKKHNFRLTVHSLNVLSKFASNKVWVKVSSEMSFLYGHHIPKAGIDKMTESIPQYGGVIVFNTQGIPLGFGLMAQSSDAIEGLTATSIAVLHQVDIGEYLRDEKTLN